MIEGLNIFLTKVMADSTPPPYVRDACPAVATLGRTLRTATPLSLPSVHPLRDSLPVHRHHLPTSRRRPSETWFSRSDSRQGRPWLILRHKAEHQLGAVLHAAIVLHPPYPGTQGDGRRLRAAPAGI